MVFSSINTSYLDPANWQQANPQSGITTAITQVLPALPSHGGGAGGGSATIRPTSMAERARMANMPMPETALKCPRCESSNTKFCYFNNYNLTQPRHFCKTCRRYWTKGGALRNVPVGGGCRRNKRNKSSGSSSSKSTASTSSTGRGTTIGCGSSTSTNSCGPTTSTLLGLCPQIPPLRFMSPLSQLSEFIPGDIGLHYGGISGPPLMQQNHDLMNNFPLGISNTSLGGGGGGQFFQAGGGGVDVSTPWRLQPNCQISSSMSGLEGHGGSGSIMFPFQELSVYNGNDNPAGRPKLGVLKMEENLQEMNLSRQLMGINQDHHHHQYNWGSGAAGTSNSWPDLSGFSSSSTTSNAL